MNIDIIDININMNIKVNRCSGQQQQACTPPPPTHTHTGNTDVGLCGGQRCWDSERGNLQWCSPGLGCAIICTYRVKYYRLSWLFVSFFYLLHLSQALCSACRVNSLPRRSNLRESWDHFTDQAFVLHHGVAAISRIQFAANERHWMTIVWHPLEKDSP